jgi:hypothetical protein
MMCPTALGRWCICSSPNTWRFIVLLLTLYVVAGGILVTGYLRGTPLVNTSVLVFGTAIASVVGTTGAAMIRSGRSSAPMRPPQQHTCHCILHHPGGECRAALSRSAIRRCSSASCTASTLLDHGASADADGLVAGLC